MVPTLADKGPAQREAARVYRGVRSEDNEERMSGGNNCRPGNGADLTELRWAIAGAIVQRHAVVTATCMWFQWHFLEGGWHWLHQHQHNRKFSYCREHVTLGLQVTRNLVNHSCSKTHLLQLLINKWRTKDYKNHCSRTSVQQLKKRKNSCFLDFEKKRKKIKKRTYSFRGL